MSIGAIASQAFVPNKLAGLKLWPDASDVATIREDTATGFVSEWGDKSSEENHSEQLVGSSQPQTGLRTINGLNVIDFDGFDNFLTLNVQPIVGTQARTIIVVGFADNGDGFNHFISLSDATTGVGGQYKITAEIGIRIDAASRMFPDDAVEDGVNAAIITATSEANSNIELNASNFQIYKNSVLLTGGSSLNETTLVDTNVGFSVIGEDGSFTSNGLDGVIGEIVIYDRVLSAFERNQLDNYLGNKWGIDRPFAPSKLAELKLWQDAPDSNTLIESGGFVSEWLDKSSEGNHSEQFTSSAQPQTGLTTINGLNTLDFDGLDDYLIGASAIEAIPLSDHTMFFVAHLDTLDELQCLLAWNDGNGASNRQIFCFSTVDGTFRVISVGGGIGSNTLIDEDLTNTDMLVTINVNHSTTITTRLNGVEKTLFSADAVNSTDSFLIGAELDPGGSVGNFINIKIGEIIMYSRDLPIAEIQQVESYLSDKWGIPVSFPFAFSSDFSEDFS